MPPHSYIKLLIGVCLVFCFFIGCLLNFAPNNFGSIRISL